MGLLGVGRAGAAGGAGGGGGKISSVVPRQRENKTSNKALKAAGTTGNKQKIKKPSLYCCLAPCLHT